MKQLLMALFVIFAALGAQAAHLAGNWDIDGSVYGNAVKYTCAFQQNGDVLSGTAHLGDKDYAVTGSTKDQTATWQFDVDYNGAPLTLVFDGALSSETAIKGTIAVSGVTGEFTAAKK